MTAGDTPGNCAEKTVVSCIMSRDTTRYGTLYTAFGFGRHGRQGETKNDCSECKYFNAFHGFTHFA
jgi:hypothetical protein